MKIRVLIFLLLPFFSYGQDRESSFFDTPFGGGGGYMPGWIISNVDVINNQVSSFGTKSISKSGFYSSGGTGFIYLPFIPYLRIGGIGFGGSTSESVVGNDGFKKEVVYSKSFGGLTVEYSLPFVRSVGLSIGTIIGGGSTSLELYKNKDAFSWNSLWNEISTSGQKTENFSRKLTNNYFFIAPTLNLDIPIQRFIDVRVGVGYSIAIGDSWTVENGQEIFNIPSDLKNNDFFVQLGILFGFFSF